MDTPLRNNEKMIKEGKANLQRGLETVGGKLYLTNFRLIFESHKFNVQSGTTKLELSNICSPSPSWTKFLNIIPITPNAIVVPTKQGNEFRFTTWERKNWINAIEEQRNKPQPNQQQTGRRPETREPPPPPTEEQTYQQGEGVRDTKRKGPPLQKPPPQQQQPQQQPQPGQPQRTQQSNLCPDCGQPIRYVEEYDSWYCDRCQDYK